MDKDRLAAFTDGVVAVIITIMVLELKAPHAADLAALRALGPVFLSYALSFVYVAVYWTNHHHLFALVDAVDGAVLWANLHMLFWLSLIPFTTSWVGEDPAAALPAALYGLSLLMAAIGWLVLQHVIVREQGAASRVARAIGRDIKGKISGVLYVAGILAAFETPWLADAIYALVAAIWLVPDRRYAAEAGRDGRAA